MISLSETIEIIAAGGHVVDIGQLTKDTRAWLRREVKAGRLEQFKTCRFPQPKTAYQRAGLPQIA